MLWSMILILMYVSWCMVYMYNMSLCEYTLKFVVFNTIWQLKRSLTEPNVWEFLELGDRQVTVSTQWSSMTWMLNLHMFMIFIHIYIYLYLCGFFKASCSAGLAGPCRTEFEQFEQFEQKHIFGKVCCNCSRLHCCIAFLPLRFPVNDATTYICTFTTYFMHHIISYNHCVYIYIITYNRI